MDEQKLTNIAELGEFGLIDHLTKDIILTQKSTVAGVGDDAAVLKSDGRKFMLVSTDLLIEGIHFDMAYTPLKHLGYKSAVVNFSDMAAMNGVPTQIVVGLGISAKYTLEAMEEFYAGIKKACELYKVDFVGGDISSSLHGLFISVTVIGEVEKDKITYRKGAKPGDILCVTGDLGGAYMGLLLLEREKKVFRANGRQGVYFGKTIKTGSPYGYGEKIKRKRYCSYRHDRYFRWPGFGSFAHCQIVRCRGGDS